MNGQAVADAGSMALGEPGPMRVMAEMLAGRGFGPPETGHEREISEKVRNRTNMQKVA